MILFIDIVFVSHIGLFFVVCRDAQWSYDTVSPGDRIAFQGSGHRSCSVKKKTGSVRLLGHSVSCWARPLLPGGTTRQGQFPRHVTIRGKVNICLTYSNLTHTISDRVIDIVCRNGHFSLLKRETKRFK